MAVLFPDLNRHIVTFENKQAQHIFDFLKRLSSHPFDTDDNFERFLTRSLQLTKELPSEVLQALLEFRRCSNDDGVIVIRGFPIDEFRIGQTPPHWSNTVQTKQYFETEMYLLGIASILGEVFSFNTQHEGNIVQNIVPVYTDINEQVGTGGGVFLEWHTEEAFHPLRADFIGLLCLRSDPSAATTFASIRQISIPDKYKRCLFEKKFQAGIDKAHGGSGKAEDGPLISVLFGQYEDPYLRIDTSCIRAKPGEIVAQEALEYLVTSITAVARQIVLQQGDLLFLDNLRVVHGRTAFKPRFDGSDRWIQRVSVTTNFHKSHMYRTQRFRVIETDLQALFQKES